MIRRLISYAFLAVLSICFAHNGYSSEPLFTRVPGDGIQPQALTAPDGTVHLVYYRGESKSGDIFYVHRSPGTHEFSRPIQVNSVRGSAIAMGTIRGPQLARGRSNRVHVAWNGSGKEGAGGMRYTRLKNDGAAFEPERDLMTDSEGLDGGGSIAADDSANVYVVWHGLKKSDPKGETNRSVFIAVSRDDGATFAPERQALARSLGACACCGLKAYADDHGGVFVLFRSARTESQRDATLIGSKDAGQTFRQFFSHPWSLNTCPMSSCWIGTGTGDNLIAGWETKGRVWFANILLESQKCSEPIAVATAPGQKFPVAVLNPGADRLFLWTEGTGWQKGGGLAWRILDQQGKLLGSGRKEGLPVWSYAAAISRADGTFEIFY